MNRTKQKELVQAAFPAAHVVRVGPTWAAVWRDEAGWHGNLVSRIDPRGTVWKTASFHNRKTRRQLVKELLNESEGMREV